MRGVVTVIFVGSLLNAPGQLSLFKVPDLRKLVSISPEEGTSLSIRETSKQRK